MIHEQIDTCISLYKEVFGKEESKHFVSLIDAESENDWSELGWEDSMVGQGMVTAFRTSVSCSLIPLFPPYPKTEISGYFHEHIFFNVEKVIDDYKKANMLTHNARDAFSVLRYFPGGEYHNHFDHHPTNSRVFSIVASLGEAEEGGELEFPLFKKTVKLGVGDVVLFPSNFPYQHIAHPVVSGIKESLVSWYS